MVDREACFRGRGSGQLEIRSRAGWIGVLVAAGRVCVHISLRRLRAGGVIGKPRTNLIRRHVEIDFDWTARSRGLLDSLAGQDQLGELLDSAVQVFHGITLIHLLSNDRKHDGVRNGTKAKLTSRADSLLDLAGASFSLSSNLRLRSSISVR